MNLNYMGEGHSSNMSLRVISVLMIDMCLAETVQGVGVNMKDYEREDVQGKDFGALHQLQVRKMRKNSQRDG